MRANAYIVMAPSVLAGKPIIRGTRLWVEFIGQLLAQGWTEADIQRRYPGIMHEQVAACLQNAADALGSGKGYPLTDTPA